MNSPSITETFWLLATFSGIGATIDFMIGKVGQKRVRSWLEVNWYKYADIRWGDFGKAEAIVFENITDALFGSKLLSWHRAISTYIVASIAAALPVVSYLLPDRAGLRNTTISFDQYWWVDTLLVLAYGLAFALSISLSKAVSRLFLKMYSRNSAVNLTLLIATLLFAYSLLVIWSPAYDVFLTIFTLAVSMAASSESSPITSLDFLRSIPMTMWGTLEVWMTPSELWTPYYIVNHIVNGYLGCQIPPCGWRPRDLSTSIKEFLFNAGGIYRIFALFGFLGLFVLEWLIRKPTSVFWARLVESDKPVFTLLFGGAAAAIKLVTEAVKHYST